LPPSAERVRADSAVRGIPLAQSPTSPRPSGGAEGRSEPGPQAPVIPAQVAGSQTFPVGAGIPGGAGGAAKAGAALDAEVAKETNEPKSSSADARLSKVDSTALQLLEERSTEHVINTPNSAVKWRINSSGFVERTEDGGATWKGQEVDAGGPLLAGSAPDEKTCWVVGRQGLIFVTKDAENWKKIPPPAPADLISVSAKDASSATVVTADGRQFSTHDRGKKWKLERNPHRSNPPQ
jgi:Photosynthesis system II assembly factor YCF48